MDILDAVADIQQFTLGLSFEDFRNDRRTVYAVRYSFGMIGEAAGHVPEELRNRYPAASWQKMRAMRNIVFHEYFEVDVSILWRTLTQDLPPLVSLLEEILERES